MFYETNENSCILRIRLTPNASKCAVLGTFADASGAVFLKISITAVPEKGKANAELIKFLSKTLKQPKTAFSFISGETDRYKKILLNSPLTPELLNALNRLENANDSENH